MQSMSEPSDSARIKIVPPQEGRELNIFGGPMIVKSDGSQIGIFLAEHPIPPGYAVPPHVHSEDDEVFWILDGELTLMDRGTEVRVGRGTSVLMPRGIPHGFRNDSAATVRILVMATTPQRCNAMFEELDRLTRDSTLPPSASRIAEIADRHKVGFV